MVFSSTVFVFVFLPLCLLTYYLLPGVRAKNIALLLFSLVFYAWGEPVYIFLMLLSILMNYAVGLYMERIPSWRRVIFCIGLSMNLLVLGFFKYYGFLIDTLDSLFGLSLEAHSLPLPIGISFYTFQALSYVIDLYRGNIRVQKKLIPFALYITMFPQLIAGPIVRYTTVEAQLENRVVSREGLGRGAARFIFGLSKKVLLANPLGAVFEQTGFQLTQVSGLSAWIGLLAYGMQIYFDFSAYSDMAIGLGQMLGFDFPENFLAPYASRSVTEFWRRWHMTLSGWFRDYVYIPLGGSRKGMGRTIFNLFVVWLLTGLWHGAGWNFVLWGLFFFAVLAIEKLVLLKHIEKWPSLLRRIYVIPILLFAWLLFASADEGQLPSMLSCLFGRNGWVSAQTGFMWRSYGVLFALGAIFSTHYPGKWFASLIRRSGKESVKCFILRAVLAFAAVLLCVGMLLDGGYNPFLYFRF